jgi:hypothetical protein
MKWATEAVKFTQIFVRKKKNKETLVFKNIFLYNIVITYKKLSNYMLV